MVGEDGGTDPCAPPPPSTGGPFPFCAPPFCVPLSASARDGGTDGGPLFRTDCQAICQSGLVLSCQLVSSRGQPMVKCYHDCTGRRPSGLAAAAIEEGSDLGVYFSRMAHLEAASVSAFRRLGRELARYGAPLSLRRATRRAARDEIRHARMARALAVRHGGSYVPPRIAKEQVRSLEAIAVENAVEGCVRETFGALTATWQATAALDPDVRRAMRTIARDETRHAALAWKVASWVEPRLDAQARRRVAEERRGAAAALTEDLEGKPSDGLVSAAGVPSDAAARAMAKAMQALLWT